jgi:hypothetical protein
MLSAYAPGQLTVTLIDDSVLDVWVMQVDDHWLQYSTVSNPTTNDGTTFLAVSQIKSVLLPGEAA